MRGSSGFTRSRWAAIGAAVAVTLGAGAGVGLVTATGSAPSSFVSITPERILDTRDGVGIGLTGPFTSPTGRDLQVTGDVAVAPSGTNTVVPAGATAVTLNVTAVQPTADGFISVRPAGTPGAPATSSLNFSAGDIIPNSVTVALSAGGEIEITYDAFSAAGPTTDVLVDVVGYYVEGSGVAGPEGPAGPKGDNGDKGDPGDPAPTGLLPIAMGQVSSGGLITNSFNVADVNFNAGSYEITFADRNYVSSAMVTVVTPFALCDFLPRVLTGGAAMTNLTINFPTSANCAFSFVTYAP